MTSEVPFKNLGSSIGQVRERKADCSCQGAGSEFSSVQLSHSVVSDSLRPPDCSTPGFPVHHQLPEFTQTPVHRVSDAIQPSHSLSPPFPPAPNPSQHHTLCMRWRKYWSFSFSIIPSKEIPGLISFRMDWLDLLAEFHLSEVQEQVKHQW